MAQVTYEARFMRATRITKFPVSIDMFRKSSLYTVHRVVHHVLTANFDSVI